MEKPDKCIESAPPSVRRRNQVAEAERDGWNAYPDGEMPDYDPPLVLEKKKAFKSGWDEAAAYESVGNSWSTDE